MITIKILEMFKQLIQYIPIFELIVHVFFFFFELHYSCFPGEQKLLGFESFNIKTYFLIF